MKPYPGTQAVLRAVSLLKALTPERPQRGLAELSQALGLNKTTAYRLLTALESEGMIERSGEAYRLGPELLALGSRAGGALDLRLASRAELQALALATRETATIEVLVGRDVLILEGAVGLHVVGTSLEIGTRWPAHTTSTGKVLLAQLPEEELRGRLQAPLAAPTPRAITEPAALRRELARVRERGYAVSAEELEPGFVAVGAPVRDAGGAAVAALSVGGPRTRLTPQRVVSIARSVLAAASRVSARLGFTEGRQGGALATSHSRKGRR